MLEAATLLIIGLGLLVWSSDRLVFGAASIAKNLGISPLIIGMTILAMGSSAPEIVVSITAALSDQADTAVGNVIGSNIANMALILGCSALIRPLRIGSGLLRQEFPLMLLITLGAGVILWDHYLSFVEGVILLFCFVSFIIGMLIKSKKIGDSDTMIAEASSEIPQKTSGNFKAALWVILGLVLLIYSADLIIQSATTIARYFGMSDLMIGLTVVAIGTSLPELAASITSVLKGEDDLAVGNVIGSNIFNILAVMGFPAILAPSVLNPLAMERDFYIMLALSILLFIFAVGKVKTINRWEGLVLLLCFVGYQGYLLLIASV